jgi:hypothetical protein
LTRGDRNRNRRIGALRAVVARDRAVLAVDLGEDKQAGALVDHEGRVLARKTVKAKAHQGAAGTPHHRYGDNSTSRTAGPAQPGRRPGTPRYRAMDRHPTRYNSP